MSPYDYDLFVIGAGSGGVRAARLARRLRRARGDRRGVPRRRHLRDPRLRAEEAASSTPRTSATTSRTPRASAGRVDGARFDWPTLIAQQGPRDRPPERRLHATCSKARASTLHRRPRRPRRTPTRVRLVGGPATSRAKHILIATGGRPRVPDDRRASSIAHHLERGLPSGRAAASASLIVGGGYIAVEFAGIFHGLGVEVDAGLSRRRTSCAASTTTCARILREEMRRSAASTSCAATRTSAASTKRADGASRRRCATARRSRPIR